VHCGRAEQVIAARQTVLGDAYAAHPERFVRKLPELPRPPEAVWINRPVDPQEAPQQFPA
jgi:putative transposase